MASFKNNGKLKLLIIVGTRPEIIRLAAVIKKCRKYFDTILAHTGQNYDYNLNGVFFHDLELEDPEVYMDAVGADLGETMGNIIAKSYQLMVQLQPGVEMGIAHSGKLPISCVRMVMPTPKFSAARVSSAMRSCTLQLMAGLSIRRRICWLLGVLLRSKSGYCLRSSSLREMDWRLASGCSGATIATIGQVNSGMEVTSLSLQESLQMAMSYFMDRTPGSRSGSLT